MPRLLPGAEVLRISRTATDLKYKLSCQTIISRVKLNKLDFSIKIYLGQLDVFLCIIYISKYQNLVQYIVRVYYCLLILMSKNPSEAEC